ncbi:MAG: ATP-dependent RNA helicase HrpA [Opitutae bacterium]|nr:ATP-dependent RNA helicase HrpA [Opitutae bacterium]
MSSRPKPPPRFRIEFPPELPISARADEIIGLLQKHQVLVLAGETGSGKTTQIPKMCLAAGSGTRGRIACTQPRRVAASSVSRRVAEELNVPWGREVGCKIRFADQTSDATLIKFMTDGMLLAELQGDPELREYDTIIVDEAHERSLNIDFILGHLRRLRTRRPDLRIVITSATIDTEAFSQAFDGAPIVEVSGRVYPVEVIYAPLEEWVGAVAPNGPSGDEPRAIEGNRPYRQNRNDEYTYLDAAEEAVERVLQESTHGDILVFLPTERDIREVRDLLEGRHLRDVEVVPLFGRLTNAEQQRVFAPTQRRKIVVATNIAETSLTIPGIRFVIDSGLARVSRYVPQSRTRRLPVEPVAQSSADQRKGRCGRVSDGVCIRLYAEQDFNDRPRFAQPEIQRSNLADVILRMKAFGLGDIEEFPFLNAPPAKGIRAGYALLEELGAIISEGRAGPLGPPGNAASVSSPARPAVAPYQEWQLTDLGRELAHLPVDPTVGRMILQARTEKALREVLIIAAALSIQDPRERPLDAQAKADAAHRRFTHPDSDFLTLLAIWEDYHDEFEKMTLGKLRKFCTAHFLSFMRMREWRDVHAQLVDTIEGREGFVDTSVFDGLTPGKEVPLTMGTPGYRAIHRSILSGLLGNIATRTDEGTYHATHDRKVAVFPGSALFERPERSGVRSAFAKASADEPRGKRTARWLMAAEIMETGKVYARTCARIDPHWALDLAAHIIRASHSEPFWNPDAGRVLVKERRRLYNLELETRSVGYGKLDPVHATEIFIREGLVGDSITWPFDFLTHNRKLREKTETILTRTRSAGYLDLDEAAYRFYAARLLPEGRARPPGAPKDDAGAAGPAATSAAASAVPPCLASPNEGGAGSPLPAEDARRGVESAPFLGISSVPELIDLVRHRQMTEPKFLCMAEDDIKPPAELTREAAAFPEALPLLNRALPLNYLYRPGKEDDGVTLRVSPAEAETLTPATLDWAVPGHLREKIELLLKTLPKEQRRTLIPLTETAEKIAAEIGLIAGRTPQPTLTVALAEVLTARLGVRIDAKIFGGKPLPDHLRVRVEVVDKNGAALGASRELSDLQQQLGAQQRQASQQAATGDTAAWRAARAKWETPAALEWKFGDLPESVVIAEHAGVPVRAYPGLQAVEAGVAVRLFATTEEAQAASRGGLAKLFETQLRYELGWLEKDLRDLRALGMLVATLTTVEALQQDALVSIRRWVTDGARVGRAGPLGPPKDDREAAGPAVPPYLTKGAFERALHEAKADLRGLVPKLGDWLKEIFTLRLALQTHKTPYPGLETDLGNLLPPDFLRRTPFARVKHLPRYLKAMQARADRWKRDPAKDSSRARELQPFVQAVAALYERRPGGVEGARAGGHRPPLQEEAKEAFRWLVEEFRVSLFAQELGTVEAVSAVRLERALQEVTAGKSVTAEEPPVHAPRKALPLPVKGKTTLKSLDALGNLPR